MNQSNHPTPTDEEILSYEKEVKKEFQNCPFVSDLKSLDLLDQEYQSHSIYLSKIQQLKQKSQGMRMIKKDGNCFYRSFGFRLLELLQQNKQSEFYNQIYKTILEFKNLFQETGYDWSIVEFFFDPFLECLDQDLEQTFNTEYTSDTIVSFLRILTASYLKKHKELEVFILDTHSSLEQFISTSVEPSILF